MGENLCLEHIDDKGWSPNFVKNSYIFNNKKLIQL
jgi:hypothetical protein